MRSQQQQLPLQLLLLLAAAAIALARAAAAPLPPAAPRAPRRVPLSGPRGAARWSLANANGSISLADVRVPGYALEALQRAGIIGDPLHRYGERDARWAAEEPVWTFAAEWEEGGDGDGSWERSSSGGAGSSSGGTGGDSPDDSSLGSYRAVVLRLGGVDAVAAVDLDGRRLAAVANAHRRWALDASRAFAPAPAPALASLPPHQRDGTTTGRRRQHELRIAIASAPAAAAARRAAHPYPVPALAALGAFEAYNFVRKPASDFGWDWGPALAPAGVPGRVELLAFDHALLVGAAPAAVLRRRRGTGTDGGAGDGRWVVRVAASLLVPPGGDAGTLSVDIPELAARAERRVTLRASCLGGGNGGGGGGEDEEEEWQAGDEEGGGGWEGEGGGAGAAVCAERLAWLTLELPAAARPRLWWPAGMGARPLYNVTVAFAPDGARCGEEGSGGAASYELRDPGDGDDDEEQQNGGGGGACSAVRRRIGFRTVELVTDPLPAAAAELLPRGAGAAGGAAAPASDGGEEVGQEGEDQQGRSFYLRVNGAPLFAKVGPPTACV